MLLEALFSLPTLRTASFLLIREYIINLEIFIDLLREDVRHINGIHAIGI